MAPSSSSSSYIATCPFCGISQAYAPCSPSAPPSAKTPSTSASAPASPSTPDSETAYTVLSTPHVLAFLDHMPITRGHILLTTRQHREKLSDTSISEAAVLGAWLRILSRAVMRGVGVLGALQREEITEDQAETREGDEVAVRDWNVVQNNGARAAQVVNHIHYHIIPRPGEVPELKNRSWTMFGRGQRGDLDEEEAVMVRDRIRLEIAREIRGLSTAEKRTLCIEDEREKGKL